MNGGIRLGVARGVEVVADASAVVLALLFGTVVFVDLLGRGLVSSNERALVLATIAGVLVVLCILAHEAAHAVVATRSGQRVLGVRIFMFGGYSVIEGRPTPMQEFRIAIAGPATSIAIGLFFWVLTLVLGGDDLVATARALALANIAIGLFNLFPGFPLDGGRVLRGLIASKGGDRVAATRVVASVGRYTGWAVMFVGVLLLVAQEGAGLFWIVAGWFLAGTAVQTGRREELTQMFDGTTAADVMHPTTDAVPARMHIEKMVDLYGMGPDMRTQVVQKGGRVVGVIGQTEIESVSPARWVSTPVERLMTPIGPDDLVDADEPLESLMVRPPGESRRAVVVRNGSVIGIIEAADLGYHLERT
jgi:Zn-dependent protease